MIDPEIEAIYKCTELLKDLETESKVRVIQYLVDRFRLSSSAGPQQPLNTQIISQQNLPPIADAGAAGTSNDSSSSEIKDTDRTEYPVLKDVVIKDLPNSESEWILVYAFYASEFGKKSFTRDDIVAGYVKSHRKTEQRIKNLTINFSQIVKNDWIKAQNDTDYILLDGGRQHVNQILSGNSKVKRKSVPKKNKKEPINSGAVAEPAEVEETIAA